MEKNVQLVAGTCFILQKTMLVFTHNLDAVAVEEVQIAAERQTGTVDVGGHHHTLLGRAGGVHHLQRGLLDDGGQGHGIDLLGHSFPS